MKEMYQELYQESLKTIKKLEKKLNPQITQLESQIKELEVTLTSTEKELEQIENNQRSCEQKISDAKHTYKKDVLDYVKKKIRDERTGLKPVVQIDDDEKIIEFDRKKRDKMQEPEDMLKKFTEQATSKKDIISQIRSNLETVKEELNRVSAPLTKEKQSRDIWLSKYERELEKEIEETSFDNEDFTDTHSSYSSSYFSSSSSYEQDRYAREQAEAAKAQAEEARKQTQIAQQQLREMQEQKRKAEKEAWERELKEFRQKQSQDHAIDSRCRSCAVISCGMRFNKSNVNCAGYRPK